MLEMTSHEPRLSRIAGQRSTAQATIRVELRMRRYKSDGGLRSAVHARDREVAGLSTEAQPATPSTQPRKTRLKLRNVLF